MIQAGFLYIASTFNKRFYINTSNMQLSSPTFPPQTCLTLHPMRLISELKIWKVNTTVSDTLFATGDLELESIQADSCSRESGWVHIAQEEAVVAV